MYKFVKATIDDLPILQEMFKTAREYMKSVGNPNQWKDDRPPLFLIMKDLSKGVTYLIKDENDEPVGTFSFTVGVEPTYVKIDGNWLNEKPYGTLHRIASAGKIKGIFDICFDFIKSFGLDIKCDTHVDNKTMIHCMEKNGFKYCGVIEIDDGTTRVAYQYVNHFNDLAIKVENDLSMEAHNLRKEVFCVEQGFKEEDEWTDDETKFKHISLYKKNELIAYARYIKEGDRAHIGRVVVKKEYRNKQYGRLILSYAEFEAIKDGITKFILGSQLQAVKFYEKSGYEKIGETFLDAGASHYHMIREHKLKEDASKFQKLI